MKTKTATIHRLTQIAQILRQLKSVFVCVICESILFAAGCATKPGGQAVDNAAPRTGQNLLSVVSTAFQDYADAKENGVASLWSISKGANAYHQVVKTTEDVKQLIVDWKATKGDGNFLERINKVLNESDASPQTKALVVAKAAETVASSGK